MPNDITIIVKGYPNTGKGVIGMIIEKALQDHGVNARYRNDDGQSEDSLSEAFENRNEILEKINPQVTIVEEHVGKPLIVGFTLE
jgi:hypothetical protein